jgi:dienelactone hydrolase
MTRPGGMCERPGSWRAGWFGGSLAVRIAGWTIAALLSVATLRAEPTAVGTTRGDAQVAAFFRTETAALEARCRAATADPEAWRAHRDASRRQLFDMLGLDPEAERPDLRPVVTGVLEHADCTVERIHFQSLPGLYVTANLYLPRDREGPVPAILYQCGHSRVVEDGVSCGNKAGYQHHGVWLARHGYATLLVDTLQLGEIEGIHHGTYREGRWWWPSRGYTPAGVEAWNAIRALDYLESRPEIDRERIGATGRSGGGAGTWWIAALDERILAAVPVAGITDLEDHVVEGVISGHCDCMFIVNTFRWDYPQVAALVHPRPLLLANTDRDRIFPLDGVLRTHDVVHRLYARDGRAADAALLITPGDHKDTQDLQVPTLRWFDHHLRGEDRPIDVAARKVFEPRALRVFATLPADERNTTIDETFVPRAGPFAPPASATAWQEQADAWRGALRERTFGGWPTEEVAATPPTPAVVDRAEADGLVLETWRFESQPHVDLDLFVLRKHDLDTPEVVVLDLLDDAGWERFTDMRTALIAKPADPSAATPAVPADEDTSAPGEAASMRRLLTARPWAFAFLAPRGIGPTAWNRDPKVHVHLRRRYLLLGQTWEGMQAFDIRRGLQAVRAIDGIAAAPVWIQAEGPMAVLAAYASLFEPPVARLDLHRVPRSHQPDGPSLLNVLRILDIPQALALAAERSRLVLYDTDAAGFAYLTETATALGWPEDRVQFRTLPAADPPRP